jgi:hypothetical protein
MMKRWNQHLKNAKTRIGRGCAHFWNAIRKYGKDAFNHKVLEVCSSLEEANEAEKDWIRSFSSWVPQFGFNLMKGGTATSSNSLTTREKLSAATKKSMTSDRRAYLSSLRKGKPLSEETRAKISASAKKNGESIAARNRSRSPEMISKFVMAGLRAKTPEVVKKIADANRGKRLSPERKEKLLEAARNMSEEARERMGNSFKGRTHSDEVRQKISEATHRQLRGPDGCYSKED